MSQWAVQLICEWARDESAIICTHLPILYLFPVFFRCSNHWRFPHEFVAASRDCNKSSLLIRQMSRRRPICDPMAGEGEVATTRGLAYNKANVAWCGGGCTSDWFLVTDSVQIATLQFEKGKFTIWCLFFWEKSFAQIRRWCWKRRKELLEVNVAFDGIVLMSSWTGSSTHRFNCFAPSFYRRNGASVGRCLGLDERNPLTYPSELSLTPSRELPHFAILQANSMKISGPIMGLSQPCWGLLPEQSTLQGAGNLW